MTRIIAHYKCQKSTNKASQKSKIIFYQIKPKFYFVTCIIILSHWFIWQTNPGLLDNRCLI